MHLWIHVLIVVLPSEGTSWGPLALPTASQVVAVVASSLEILRIVD